MNWKIIAAVAHPRSAYDAATGIVTRGNQSGATHTALPEIEYHTHTHTQCKPFPAVSVHRVGGRTHRAR
eukprot:4189108-Amphidinium_carterae.1